MGTHSGEPKLAPLPQISIETPRLILRSLKLSDAPAIFDYAQNDNVTKHLLWSSHKTLKDSESFIKDYAFPSYAKNQPEPLGICLKENPDHVIGTVGSFWVSIPSQKMELGCALSEKYWGQGLMGEAMKAMIDYCFTNHKVKRIQAQCKVENTQSFKMLTKIGMTHEGTLKNYLFSKNRFWDMEMFSISC
jgi:ribosomal-protein-alanine N-acetyltransferase